MCLQAQLCETAFVLHVLDADWLLSAVGCVLCYHRAAEASHNNALTEASHAVGQHDSTEHQWLACIQLAQLLLDRHLCFLVFAMSGV